MQLPQTFYALARLRANRASAVCCGATSYRYLRCAGHENRRGLASAREPLLQDARRPGLAATPNVGFMGTNLARWTAAVDGLLTDWPVLSVLTPIAGLTVVH
jgi:hypothetical protein